VPFTVGQAFKQGDIGASSAVVANIANFQAVVKNRWPDGSVKYAVLSGTTDLSAGAWKSITLSAGAAPAAQPSLTTADLKATGATAAIQFGSFGTASWSGTDWDSPAQTVTTGPQMSAWAYRKPIGGDAHLVAWLEVRAYKGGRVEVMPWIENGYLNVTGPTSKSGTATFTLGGTSRFSQSLALRTHQRVPLASGTTLTHWIGGDPQVTPAHDAAYLMATRLVPNYRGVTASGSVLYSRLPTGYTPLAQGGYSPVMSAGGYQPAIGMLPEWDAAYLTTKADPRVWRGLMINAMLAGQFGTHFRDETTNRPLKFSAYPNLVLTDSSWTHVGSSATGSYTPYPTSGSEPALEYDIPHHPQMGYMAYLLSGWNYFLEELQLQATANFLAQSTGPRQGSKGIMETTVGTNATRGAAWAIRTLALAASATPDADPLRGEFLASIDANVDYYYNRYIATPNNPLGVLQPYSNYNAGAAPYQSAIWMDDFFTAACGWLKELKVNGSTQATRLDAFLAWKYRSVVGRLGASSADNAIAYPYAAQYVTNYAPNSETGTDWSGGTGPWYADWKAVAASMSLPTTASAAEALNSGYPTLATAYWGNLMPALAYAVDHGATGAAAAWDRVIGASNFPSQAAGYNDDPVWGIKPRTR
jgi:hypothetical protein